MSGAAFCIVYWPATHAEHVPCASFMVPERYCLTYLADLVKHFQPGARVKLWDDTHTHAGRTVVWEATCT